MRAPICGHDALIRYTERWLDAWESCREHVDEIIDGGELVVGAVDRARPRER